MSKAVNETNPLPSGYHEDVTQNATEVVDWRDPDLVRIVRLRLLSDPGYPVWDVSYCHGQLKNGKFVRVDLPFDQLPKGRGAIQKAIINYAKRDKVFAKGLGLFEAISTLN